MPLFSGKGFYPIGKSVLDHWSFRSTSWHQAKLFSKPTAQSLFQYWIIYKEESCKVFWKSLRSDLFCLEFSLHSGDPWISVLFHVIFRSNLNIFVSASELLNHSADLLHKISDLLHVLRFLLKTPRGIERGASIVYGSVIHLVFHALVFSRSKF